MTSGSRLFFSFPSWFSPPFFPYLFFFTVHVIHSETFFHHSSAPLPLSLWLRVLSKNIQTLSEGFGLMWWTASPSLAKKTQKWGNIIWKNAIPFSSRIPDFTISMIQDAAQLVWWSVAARRLIKSSFVIGLYVNSFPNRNLAPTIKHIYCCNQTPFCSSVVGFDPQIIL